MDFISSISFPNEPLISWTFLEHFCHHFWVGLLLLCCCTHPKVMTKIAKKCWTDQRFIRKRNTTYKIHTLVRTFVAALFSTHSSAKFLLFHTRWTFREFLTTYLVLLVVWPNLRQFFIEHSNAAHCSVGLVNWTKNNGSRKRIFGAKIPIHK